MKPAATYIHRPLAIEAIQVPPAGSAPSGFWMASLQGVIGSTKYEFGKRGQLALLFQLPDKSERGYHLVPVVGNPGDWIVRRSDDIIEIHSDETFHERFTEPGKEHKALEAERLHITLP